MYGISQDPNTKDCIMVFGYDFCCCKKCGNKYTDTNNQWCQPCQINKLKANFTNWTSKNKIIDDFIQEMQLNMSHCYDIVFEWIPFDHFDEINYISEDDFATYSTTLYSARWKDGPLYYNITAKKYKRLSNKKVILGSLNNSQSSANKFLNEVWKLI